MAGVKRYKAGTIFLDVAPSFDNLQRQIKKHIEDGNLEKAAEDQGRKQGEALAKGEEDAYRKAAEKNLERRKENNKAVNQAMVTDTSKAWRDMARAAERAEQEQTQSAQQGAKDRGKIGRSEADEKKNLIKSVDHAHTEAIKEQTQREKAARKEQADGLKAFGQRYREELGKKQQADKQAAIDADAARRREEQEEERAHRDRLRRIEDEKALAEAMADGRERAMERRIGKENAAQRKQADERKQQMRDEAAAYDKNQQAMAQSAEEALQRRTTAEQKASRDREREAQRSADAQAKIDDQANRDREQKVQASGGRIGRLIRKSVGNAVEDLPPINLDADSSRADKVLADVRQRLIALRDAKIGVDIDTGKARAELTSLQTALRTVARNHDGSVRINSMAALASLQAVENKINSIQREARKPILLRIRSMGGMGDGNGIGADGANAFRAFNVAVLAVASALALLGPLLTVAAAGIATLAGAAIAGGAGLGVLALGFVGVFQAIGDQIKAEDEVGQASEASAKKRSGAAKQVRDAKQRLAEAEKNAARSTADAARQVSDAERGASEARKQASRDIASAVQAEKDAQRNLVDARRQATEGVKNALEAEKDAQRGIADARKQATEAVRNALETEKDAQRNLADARKQAAETVRAAIESEKQAQRSLADARRDAAEAVRNAIESEKDAQRSLVDARQQAARDIESAIEQQSQAERRLEDAQRSATKAQRDLTEARREARREIEDLSMSYRQSQLAEAEAAVAITQSQERLNEVRRRAAKGQASQADVRQASIDVQQARLRAEEMRTRRKRAGADSARATKGGVEGSDRVQTAKERVRSAEQQVVDSQKALAKASKGIADARVKGAQRVAKAERDVAKASRATAKARTDGARRIADAEKAVEKAAQNTAKARADGARKISDAERSLEKASRAVRKAREEGAQRIADAERTAAKAAQATAKARADGARRISDAERAVAEASANTADARTGGAQRIADAERNLSDAQRNQRRTSEDNASAIAKAQQGIRDAQMSAADATEAQSAAARNAAQSMAALAPAGQRFARFILGLRGEFDKLKNIAQSGMLPGLEQGMRELGVYKDGFRKFVGDMSKMWGDLFASFGKQLTNDTWSSFFNTMGKDAPKQTQLLSQSIFNVLETIAALTDAFSPLTTEMLTWLEKATAGWADWAANLKGSPGFERFLDYVREIAPIVRDFLLALGRAFIAVGVALAPFAEGFMKVLTKLFDYIADMDPTLLGKIATGLIAVVIAMQLGNGAVALMTSLLNPLGSRLSLIVFVLTLVVLGLIYLYQTNDTARKYIDRFLGALKSLGGYMLEHIGTIAKVVAAVAGLFMLYKVVRLVMAVRKAMMLLGLTMKLTFLLNPYVLAIAALVGIIIYLWRTNESFRKAVKWAWAQIKKAMKAVVDWFTETAAPAMGKAFRWVAKKVIPILRAALRALGKFITWLWERVIHPTLKVLRKVFVWVFKAVAASARWLWRKILKPVFREMNKWMKEIIGPAVRWLWRKVIKPSFEAIAKAGKWLWRKVLRPVFRALNKFIKNTLGPAFSWLWRKVIKPVFKWIGDRIEKVVKSNLKWLGKVRDFLRDKVGPTFSKFWKKVVKPAMKGIARIVKWAWEERIRPAFRKIRSGLDTLKDGFDRAKKGIKKIWKGLTDVVKDPINSALKFIQRNFIEKINSLLKKAGLDIKLPNVWSGGSRSKASGKRAATSRNMGGAQRAEGGLIPGPYVGPKADNVLGVNAAGMPIVRVNPREYVTQVSSTEKMERKHPGLLDYINKYGDLPGHARGGMIGSSLPGYAKGGKVKKGSIVALGKVIQKMGYHVSEHPSFGGVAKGAHSAKGYHYKGGALDINADSFNSKFKSEAPALDKLNKYLRGLGWNTIWRAPNHYDHLHVDIGKGGKAGGGIGIPGIGGFFDKATQKALDWITDKGKGIVNKIPGKNVFTKMSKSLLKKALGSLKSKVEEEGDMGADMDESGGGGGGKGVSRWRGTVLKALKIMNQPAGLASRVLNQIRTESGGNPRAINRWDSNAKRGTPSKGLLQTIDPTYRAFAHPKYNKGPYHPMSNILASMRYAIRTYGSLKRAYRGVGYAKGTDKATSGWHMVGEEGPELMRFRGGEQVYNRNQTMKLAELASKGGQGGGGVQKVYVENPWTGKYHEARMRDVVEDHAEFEKSVQRMRRP